MPKKQKYQYLSEFDFINDKDFQDWIIHPGAEKDHYWNNFIKTHPEKKEAFEKASSLLKGIRFKEEWPSEENVQSSLREALAVINTKEKSIPQKVVPLYRRWWAAAAVLLLLASGSYFFLNREHSENEVAAVKKKVLVNDAAPGGNKAILTLANGSTIILTNAKNGALTQQGNTKVIKLDDGQLAYQPEETNAPIAVQYNTVSTPRGGQYQLTLADGSKVWLNAESSITFPTAFIGNERKVEIKGEAYFEVAHDASRPFQITANGMEVQVLGTHFNIKAYSDENFIRTTLLLGSVKVSKGNESTLIVPGEQAKVSNSSDEISVKKNVDLDEVVAWKNGLFNFNEADLKKVMSQLSRWYDVNVIYEGTIPKREFGGEMQRNLNLSQVLQLLEKNNVHFEIEGKNLVVTP